VYRDYAPKGVQFFYVYKTVQHPGINNFVEAYDVKERLMHVAEAKRRLQSRIPWICDNMENEVKHAFGRAPNGEFVIDPEGVIVRKRFWSNPRTLRSDLTELVGPVEKPTRVEDLPTRFRVEKRQIASGVVPRLELPSGLKPVRVTPAESDTPYYVKLRAEATPALLENGEGQLYLGFYLDPLYQVHWNNEAGRITVEVKSAGGGKVEPSSLQGPQVEVPADTDPRQFLVDVKAGEDNAPLELSVHYMACDDAETFCVPVTQHYRIELTRDRDGGSRPGIFMPAMFADAEKFDKDGDGKITKAELPAGRVTLYIGHMDLNGDHVIDREELATFMAMFNNGRGFRSARNDGQPPTPGNRADEQ